MERLKKDDLINVVNNLKFEDIKKEVLRLSFHNLNNKKPINTITALLSLKNGNVEYKSDNIDDLENFVTLVRYDLKPFYLDYEGEDILDGDSLNEFLSVVEDEESEFFEEPEYALEYILDKYELDKDELVKEHFIKSNLENVKIFNVDAIIDKL